MNRKDGIVLIVLAVILFGLILLEPSYGWTVRRFLTPGAPTGGTETDNPTLAAENESLRAEIAKLTAEGALAPAPAGSVRAMVYSRYPLNFKNELLVDAGTDEGVATGKAVTFQGIMIGSVLKAFPDSALVQTIFDNNFRMPVRIGDGGYDALLAGGSYPEAVSIKKGASVARGDIVYSAAPGFPYGLPLAVVASTSTSPDGLFETATLSFSYDINEIETVTIAR